ncbi:MAG: glycosyltransferase family 2 protein [Gammaproteobacteria bacterium]|nr:glycosyltransferase family 2 protein [Gammaproteobacteria bacterium]
MISRLDSDASVSIVVPCYNEEDNIEHTLQNISKYMTEHFPKKNYELLPINDGSTDKTAEIIQKLSNQITQIVPSCGFEKNRGRGSAIKHGISISKGDYVICLDADLSYDVEHIGEILSAFELVSSPDVVVVSPYMRGGSVQGVPLMRIALSRMANWVLAGSFPNKLHTVTCMVRGYRGELVRNTPFFEDSKELHLEMLNKLAIQGAKILEIPGKLHWKKQKQVPRRKTPLKFVSSAKKHLLYGLLLKPTRIFQATSLFIILLAFYESAIILQSTWANFQWSDGFFHSLWLALASTYQHSPHTFLIAVLAFLLGAQMIFFLILFQVLMMQHIELKQLLLFLGNKSSIKSENVGLSN